MLHKHKVVLSVIILILLCILLTSCKNPLKSLFGKDDTEDIVQEEEQEGLDETMQDEDGLRSTVLYYQDKHGYLVPVMRKIPWEEGIAKKAINALIDEPVIREEAAEMGLYPTLPEGTEILGMAIIPDTGNLARIDFNKNFMNYSSAAEENCIVQSIVYTLTEFPTIDQVELIIEGERVKELTYGTDISAPLTREVINVQSDSYSDSDQASNLMVYFYNDSNPDFEYFVPVTKIVATLEPNIESAIEEIIKGPDSDSELKSGIPEGTKLLGVQVKDGIAYINFSKEFNNFGEDKQAQERAIKAIVLTVKEFGDIKEVKILVEGQELESDNDTFSVPTFANEY
ncbi:MAG: GerMN domain-containing protein [Clostridia bacterium]|nr:GerMN domain-containing protein [Clostridia bacterium]